MTNHTDAQFLYHYAKCDVRARILRARRGVDTVARAAADTALQAAMVDLATASGRDTQDLTIAAYVPLWDEPGGANLPEALSVAVAPGRLLLPVLQPDQDLDWAAYAGPDSLRAAARGLREPTGARLGAEAINRADLVFVPALAVDRRGVRLGRGGGSYDRALARVSPAATLVTPLYPGELLDDLPRQPHDRPVTGVLIPDGPTIRTVWCAIRPVSLDSTCPDPAP